MATKRKTTAVKKAKPNILVSVFIRFLPCFFLSDCIVNFSNCNCKFSITIADRLQLQLQLFLEFKKN